MKRAIVLMNMGGPNNTDEIEVFLTNMFNDKNIIAAPKLIRMMIAKLIVWKRLDEAKSNYTFLGGKSPLVGYTKQLIEKLQVHVDAPVHMVMRYTPPFSYEVLKEMRDVDEIYALALYPHYSSTTTRSSIEDLNRSIKSLGLRAKVKTIASYYRNVDYIDAIVARIKETLGAANPNEFELVFSAHGLPKKIIEKGDPYQKHIRQNVYFARKALMKNDINFANTHLAYQSRLGPIEWIHPYLEDKLKSLKKKKVLLFPIAFTLDNSETEFELEIEYRQKANELGIEDYRVAKAPNDHPSFVTCLANIYEELKVSL